jgi:Zn-finger nucleic acid-binding protein
MELSCPKCHGTMRTYERNGVHVDQCADCRGIFLDRGELDRLIDAENAWHGGGAVETGRHQPDRSGSGHGERYRDSAHRDSDYRDSDDRDSGHREQYRDPDHRDSRHRQETASAAGLSGMVGEVLRQVQGTKHSGSQPGYGHKRKKESFLGDLFG